MARQVKADCGANLIKRSHLSTAPVRVSSRRKRVVTPFYGFPAQRQDPGVCPTRVSCARSEMSAMSPVSVTISPHYKNNIDRVPLRSHLNLFAVAIAAELARRCGCCTGPLERFREPGRRGWGDSTVVVAVCRGGRRSVKAAVDRTYAAWKT